MMMHLLRWLTAHITSKQLAQNRSPKHAKTDLKNASTGLHPLLCSQCPPEDAQQREPVHVSRVQEDFPGAGDVYHEKSTSVTFFSAERRKAVQACGNPWKGEGAFLRVTTDISNVQCDQYIQCPMSNV